MTPDVFIGGLLFVSIYCLVVFILLLFSPRHHTDEWHNIVPNADPLHTARICNTTPTLYGNIGSPRGGLPSSGNQCV